MLYCKKCQSEVTKSETEITEAAGKFDLAPGDGINPAPGHPIRNRTRTHASCGGEVVDRDSVEKIKKILHPESE